MEAAGKGLGLLAAAVAGRMAEGIVSAKSGRGALKVEEGHWRLQSQCCMGLLQMVLAVGHPLSSSLSCS